MVNKEVLGMAKSHSQRLAQVPQCSLFRRQVGGGGSTLVKDVPFSLCQRPELAGEETRGA